MQSRQCSKPHHEYRKYSVGAFCHGNGAENLNSCLPPMQRPNQLRSLGNILLLAKRNEASNLVVCVFELLVRL